MEPSCERILPVHRTVLCVWEGAFRPIASVWSNSDLAKYTAAQPGACLAATEINGKHKKNVGAAPLASPFSSLSPILPLPLLLASLYSHRVELLGKCAAQPTSPYMQYPGNNPKTPLSTCGNTHLSPHACVCMHEPQYLSARAFQVPAQRTLDSGQALPWILITSDSPCSDSVKDVCLLCGAKCPKQAAGNESSRWDHCFHRSEREHWVLRLQSK